MKLVRTVSMKQQLGLEDVVIVFVVVLVLVACSPSAETEPTKEPKNPTMEPAPALPTLDTSLVATAYPGPSDPVSPAEPESDPTGYPPPPLATPTPYAYPEGTEFWMLRAAGIQCEDKLYPTLKDATAALENNGVTVLEAEEVNMMVCEACDCPTSEHYRVLISADEFDSAVILGWVRE